MTANLERVRGAYAAFARGDAPAVIEVLAHDIEWTEAEGFPVSCAACALVYPDALAAGARRPR